MMNMHDKNNRLIVTIITVILVIAMILPAVLAVVK
ncbi:MAG: synaptobrevin-B [Brotaphodocola sp.]